MSRVPNPFSRPSASLENPEVLALDDFRPPRASAGEDHTAIPDLLPAAAPTVAPKPLPPPEMEEKKIRVSLKVTAAEHWELKKRIADSNMGVDEYLHAIVFPPPAG